MSTTDQWVARTGEHGPLYTHATRRHTLTHNCSGWVVCEQVAGYTVVLVREATLEAAMETYARRVPERAPRPEPQPVLPGGWWDRFNNRCDRLPPREVK